MNKELVKINFVDFWPSFQKKDNYFYHLLSQKYQIEIDEINPDIAIGSYGFSSQKEIIRYKDNKKIVKIYYTGENDSCPEKELYDICMTQHRSENLNHFRLPLWAFFTSWFNESPFVHNRDPSFLIPWNTLDKSKLDLEAIIESKKKFCSFIYADLTNERQKWFDVVSSLSKVESAGQCLNNTGIRIPGRGDQIYKLAFLSDFFFSLAIENSCVNGYATEKLLHPMSVTTIPLYWGDPHVENDINIQSIVDLRNSVNDVLDEVRFLMSSKKAYLQKLEKPWFCLDHSLRYKLQSLEFIDRFLQKREINQ